ncbi:MAG: hypothetical protein HC927_09245, partial [Deltaproteobacteria bacterium]|nr:hypothetical protein [Deltaproteobacteria bacterium]
DPSAPLRRDQLELYLCCVRAEQELAHGELEAAWAWVAWWFADRDYRKPPKVSLYPVASTLLRVAALSNHMAEARSLASVVEASPVRRFRATRRTVHGDDPRALGHAKALVFARVGAWTEAAGALEGIASLPGIICTERDEVLYVLLAQKISALTPGVDPRLCAVSPRSVERVRPYLARVWPQLLQRIDAQRGGSRRGVRG